MNSEEHEAKCRRCGRCCHYKTTFGGKPFFTNIPCRHLDTATNLCKSYAKRYSLPDGCLPFDVALQVGAFPADCPYVQGVQGYVAPGTYDELIDEMIRSSIGRPKIIQPI